MNNDILDGKQATQQANGRVKAKRENTRIKTAAAPTQARVRAEGRERAGPHSSTAASSAANRLATAHAHWKRAPKKEGGE